MSWPWAGWWLALVLGARHASEPDHLVAVSTLLTGVSSARRAAWLGAVWGLGHSSALLGVGGALLGLHFSMAERTAAVFELGVAIMLAVLGVRSLRRARDLGLGVPKSPASSVHVHRLALVHADADVHEHVHPHVHGHAAQRGVYQHPLVVGLIHGLAGSGVLSALALSQMPTFSSAVVYMLCFGAGSAFGMTALTGLAGLSLMRFTRRARTQAWLCAGAGIMSLSVGCLWGVSVLAQW